MAMTLEEFLQTPFKYDGKAQPVPVSEIWSSLTRAQRREVQRHLKKGRVPNICDYL
jgi:hypothetical protein